MNAATYSISEAQQKTIQQSPLPPLYLQVKDIMLQRLAKNEFKPGDLLPANRFSSLENHAPAKLPNTLCRYYETYFDLPVISATEKLKAVVADENDAKHLGIKCGRPLLEIDRVAIGHGNLPLEWRVSRCNTARYHYLTDLE